MANNPPSIEELNVELVKLNTRWRVATSLISLGLLGIATYGNIKLQELQSSVISTEVLKTEVAGIKKSLDDMKGELTYNRELLNKLLIERK